MLPQLHTLLRHTRASALTAATLLTVGIVPTQIITRPSLLTRASNQEKNVPGGIEKGNRAAREAMNNPQVRQENTWAETAVHAASKIQRIIDHDDIHANQRIIAGKTLEALPALCAEHITNLYVQYSSPEYRGLSGANGVIIISGNVPDNEFRGLLIHECGHITDLRGLRGTQTGGVTSFFDGREPIFADDPSVRFYEISWKNAHEKKSDASASDFVSGYAATDAFEDSAETYAFFALHKEEFAKLAEKNDALKKKYRWMEENVFREPKQFTKNTQAEKSGKIWDVTKLAYSWIE